MIRAFVTERALLNTNTMKVQATQHNIIPKLWASDPLFHQGYN